MEEGKGECRHGKFELTEGCPQCIAERREELNSSQPAPRPNSGFPAISSPETNIVKVTYAEGSREYSYYSEDRLNVGDIVMVQVKDRLTNATVTGINVPESEVEAFKDKVKTIPADSVLPPEAEVNSPENTGKRMEAVQPKQKLDTKVNLCDTCTSRNDYPVCGTQDIEFGNGKGDENIIHCGGYAEGLAAPSTIPIGVEIRPAQSGETAPETAVALLPGEDLEAHTRFETGQALLEYANARVIATAEDAESANDDLVIISALKKAMEAKRVELVKPMQEEVKTVQETYKTIMAPVLEADRITRAKMVAFKVEEERKQREAEELNRQALEVARKQAEMNNGEFTVETTPVVVETAPRLTRTGQGVSGLTDNWLYRIVDEALIPREYMMPNDVMLKGTAEAHHDKRSVPGIEFYNDPGLTVRRTSRR